jgi:hypothetical protein
MEVSEQHRRRSPHITGEILPWLRHLYLQSVHLLVIDLNSRFPYNATRPQHLSRLFHLHIELHSFKEVITIHPNQIFWHVMCQQRCRPRRLTTDVCFVDRQFYTALADLACSRLASTVGERSRRLRPRLALLVNAAANSPIRPQQQSVNMAPCSECGFWICQETLS